MMILDVLLTQLAENEGETAVAGRCPTNRNARNIKRQVETNNQRTGSHRLPEYPLDEFRPCKRDQFAVCFSHKAVG